MGELWIGQAKFAERQILPDHPKFPLLGEGVGPPATLCVAMRAGVGIKD